MFNMFVKKINPEAILPTYARPGDAGADLYSCDDVDVAPGQHHLVDTGLAFAIPSGWVGLVHPRSGLAAKYGVTVLNAPGTVDSGYRGKVMVNLINLGSEIFTVSKGDRIAQLVLQRVEEAVFIEVEGQLSATARGDSGHGSTGRNLIDGRI